MSDSTLSFSPYAALRLARRCPESAAIDGGVVQRALPQERPTEAGSLTVKLKVRPAALAAVLSLPDPTSITVNADVPASITPQDNAPLITDAQDLLTTHESLRKEMAKLHLDYVNNTLEQLETNLVDLARDRDEAVDKATNYQAAYDWQHMELGTAVERAFEARISTLEHQPNDDLSVSSTKTSLTNKLKSVHAWGHEVRKAAQDVTTAESGIAIISKQKKERQKLRDNILKSL
ncbi:uncharacterized protein NECHADRAFT_82229 [Fusarium vanettenii 77-13-4]|uniref:Uncharacterized protein n=1 Tax=Fusarium vanettenii (strain ATCC MYA-4622 / CBS 123669 / FGSC 9596 / NRRL 45880 / 77-13-4) TaxID=660122 RepID=C7ZJL8_FUSV7|nr:uncharacterized protein NECHADRAFT_82229 [Fusarium vanettenii 77-13-4]EEU35762.1 predicted protein [Fusarium vanettenii 77-13-4]